MTARDGARNSCSCAGYHEGAAIGNCGLSTGLALSVSSLARINVAGLRVQLHHTRCSSSFNTVSLQQQLQLRPQPRYRRSSANRSFAAWRLRATTARCRCSINDRSCTTNALSHELTAETDAAVAFQPSNRRPTAPVLAAASAHDIAAAAGLSAAFSA